MARSSTFWILAALSPVLALGLGGCDAPRSNAAPAGVTAPAGASVDPIPVTVATVTPRTMERSLQVVGTLFGEEETLISPKVEGRISRVLHDLGDVVHPGDLLLTIDDTELRLAVVEARKAVEMELAKIGLKELPEGELAVDSIPTVIRAAAVEQNTLLKLNRAKSLSRVIVSEEDFEARESDHRVARAAHAVAVLEATATLSAARHKLALVASAEDKLRETRVMVPGPSESGSNEPARDQDASYVVAERLVSEGEMVRESPATHAFRLVMDRTLKLRVAVPERYSGRVRSGQTVKVTVESYPGELFEGEIRRVSPTVDRESRSFQVEARLENQDRRLKAGSFAKASILTGSDEGALTVPEEAIVTFAGISRVFCLEEGKARSVEVKPGSRVEGDSKSLDGVWVEVSGSIAAGAQVITSGHAKIVDGTMVRSLASGTP